jgi:hypothetical protein
VKTQTPAPLLIHTKKHNGKKKLRGEGREVIWMKKLESLPINTPKQAFQNSARKPKNISHSKFPFHLIQYSTETNNPQI